MKDWIINKARELAIEHFYTEYDYLPEKLQMVMYSMANKAYKDHLAHEIDSALERYYVQIRQDNIN